MAINTNKDIIVPSQPKPAAAILLPPRKTRAVDMKLRANIPMARTRLLRNSEVADLLLVVISSSFSSNQAFLVNRILNP